MKTIAALSAAVSLSLSINSASVFAVEDMVKVAPNNTKVLLENDQIRVIETRIKPGEKVAKHAHPARVVYYLNPAKERVTMEGKSPQEITAKAGEAAYFDAVKLEMANVGTTESHTIVVELKDSQGAASQPK